MVPATDIVAEEHVDRLRDRALDGEVDEIDLLATLAADLLGACRAPDGTQKLRRCGRPHHPGPGPT